MLEQTAGAIDKVTNPLSRYASVTGSILVLVMAGLIFIDVISRLVFNQPFSVTIELEQFMLACAVYLSISWAMINNDHVKVDLFVSKFSPDMRLNSQLIFLLWSIFFFAIVTWQMTVRAIEAFQIDDVGEVTGIPIFIILGVVVLCSALMTLVLLKLCMEGQATLLKKSPRPFLRTFLILLIAALGILAPWLVRSLPMEIPLTPAGVFIIFALLTTMFLGFRIALAMGFIGFIGTWLLASPDTSLSVLRMHAYDSVADYFLCVVPFFVLMGMICFRSGLSRSAYDAAYNWLGPMPGGVAISTIAGCGGFAAICGDSMATAATMGSVSLPEMKKYKYSDSLATGALAAGGTLGILIPPSIGFIVYGLIAEVSVAKLFMAGILPGVLMAVLFGVTILIRCKMNPVLGPPAKKIEFAKKMKSLLGIGPVAILFVIVIGGIYSGSITPTEAGAIGVLGALVIGLFTGERLRWKSFFKALEESMRMTAMIFLILIGVSILGFFMVTTEIPLKMATIISSLAVSRYVVLGFIMLLYLVLGMVMNIIPMIMLTLPVIFPTVQALGFDPIWFGVITVIIMEMGQITPPVGINVFVISGVAKDVPMLTIFKGVVPFLLVQGLIILILIIFPGLATYLPSLMETLPSIGG
ncbi:MAG: TRAP transporter large permease subunit [Desulfobacteraceae bacterium]|nr:TRAP transporter large permease subunit [Desulfobacteraceae bacterium]